MKDEDREQMAANAKELIEFSQKVLTEAMASCQAGGFVSISLNIPANITGYSAPPPMLTQEEIWQQINQLYTAQGGLFNSSHMLTKPMDGKHNNDSQLDDIDRLLGS